MGNDEFESKKFGEDLETSEKQNITVKLEPENGAVSVQASLSDEADRERQPVSVAANEKEQPAPETEGTLTANDVGSQFAGLPIESLILKPIIAAGQGQQELTAVYIDGLKKLAYDDQGNTKTLTFSYKRPIIKPDGSMDTQTCDLEVPLLSLVPLPAFTMDEVTVDFNMEVKDMEMSDSKTHADVSSTVSYNSWFGLNASITGNVSSDTEHKRQTDSTATYKIHARAVQQPPSEGMAKLTSLFSQAMEPINNKSK